MYERVLVPLDGSKVAESVLSHIEELVSKLAPGLKVEVTLFQVLSRIHYVVAEEVSASVRYTEMEMEQIKKQAMGYLDKTGEDLRSKGAIVKCKVGFGKVADEIVKVADEINADLIAMSTHLKSLTKSMLT